MASTLARFEALSEADRARMLNRSPEIIASHTVDAWAASVAQSILGRLTEG
jgi:hypothetical protein